MQTRYVRPLAALSLLGLSACTAGNNPFIPASPPAEKIAAPKDDKPTSQNVYLFFDPARAKKPSIVHKEKGETTRFGWTFAFCDAATGRLFKATGFEVGGNGEAPLGSKLVGQMLEHYRIYIQYGEGAAGVGDLAKQIAQKKFSREEEDAIHARVKECIAKYRKRDFDNLNP